ncbi:MAG: hypothetical protein ACI3VN_08270 [Candidatus Onthomonas sp.]
MKNAKQTLLCGVKAAAFLLVLVLLLGLLDPIFQPKDNRKDAGMNFISANGYLAEPENTIDVLYLGDSLTYSSYSPLDMWEQRGFTGYVSAVGGGRMNTAYQTLRKFLKTQHPKVVVLEAHVAARYTPGNESLLTEAELLFPLFENHDRWKQLSLSDLTAPVHYTRIENEKGFRCNMKIRGAEEDSYMEQTGEKSSLNLITRIYLNRMVRLCQENDIQLLIAATPSQKNWDYKKHNTMEQFAAENRDKGVDFLDMSLLTEEIPIDWETDSRDGGDHLNYYGAMKVSAYMADYLANCYDLPDHRDDDAYSAWNDAYAQYQEELS